MENYCACKGGYKLDNDGRSCKDIDECSEIHYVCSGHKCINIDGDYECKCFDGYEVVEDANFERNKRCQVIGDEKPSLIFSSLRGIRRSELSSDRSFFSHYASIYEHINSAASLDFNLKENYLIWSDSIQNALYIGPFRLNESKS